MKNIPRVHTTTTNKPDSKTCPAWLRDLIRQAPYLIRDPSPAVLKQRFGSTDRAVVEPKVREWISHVVRKEALRLYGPDHPQAQPDYQWRP